MGMSASKPQIIAAPVQTVSLPAHGPLDVVPSLLDRYEKARAPTGRQRDCANDFDDSRWRFVRLIEILGAHASTATRTVWASIAAVCRWLAAFFTANSQLDADAASRAVERQAATLKACHSPDEIRRFMADIVGTPIYQLLQRLSQDDVETYVACIEEMRDSGMITENEYHDYQQEFRSHEQ